jgi:hypothetical protein
VEPGTGVLSTAPGSILFRNPFIGLKMLACLTPLTPSTRRRGPEIFLERGSGEISRCVRTEKALLLLWFGCIFFALAHPARPPRLFPVCRVEASRAHPASRHTEKVWRHCGHLPATRPTAVHGDVPDGGTARPASRQVCWRRRACSKRVDVGAAAATALAAPSRSQVARSFTNHNMC